jgi:hypothetical protein
MFSEVYKGVTHFGFWAEETADRYGRRDALEVLRLAAERCAEDDQRTQELQAAIQYLCRFATRPVILERLQAALEEHDPVQRVRLALEAYRAIERHLGGS